MGGIMKKSTILSVISAVVVVLVAVFVLVMVLRKPHTAGGEPEASQPGEITWDSLTEPDSPGADNHNGRQRHSADGFTESDGPQPQRS